MKKLLVTAFGLVVGISLLNAGLLMWGMSYLELVRYWLIFFGTTLSIVMLIMGTVG